MGNTQSNSQTEINENDYPFSEDAPSEAEKQGAPWDEQKSGPIVDEKKIGTIQLVYVSKEQFQKEPFHKNIGLIQFRGGLMKKKYGTGFLISPNLVLTAAHNIYSDKRNDYPPLQVMFYPGLNRQSAKRYVSTIFSYPQQYYNGSKWNKFDFALIKLTEQVQMESILLGFNFDKEHQELSIFGYPGNGNYRKSDKDEIVGADQKGVVGEGPKYYQYEGTEMLYQITTEEGMSGSPVFLHDNTTSGSSSVPFPNIVVALHKANERIKMVNAGLCITFNMILRLQLMRMQMKGLPFRVIDMKKMEEIDLTSSMCLQFLDILREEEDNFCFLFERIKSENHENRQDYTALYREFRRYTTEEGMGLKELLDENEALKQKNLTITGKKKEYKSLAEQWFKSLKQKDFETKKLIDKIQELEHKEIDNLKYFSSFVVEEKESLIIVDKNKFTLEADTGKLYQIKSLYPFPKNKQTTVKFKIHCIGKRYPISFGIMLDPANLEIVSSPIVYFIQNPKSENHTVLQAESLDQHQQIIIEMKVNFVDKVVSFQHGSRNPHLKKLSEEFIRGDVYLICQMKNKNDCFQIVNWK